MMGGGGRRVAWGNVLRYREGSVKVWRGSCWGRGEAYYDLEGG